MRRRPPHHLSPAWAKHPAGPDPEASPSHPKSPQQRSDQTRKPVNSEQDSCSYVGGFAHQFKCVVNIFVGERDPARYRNCDGAPETDVTSRSSVAKAVSTA